MIISILAIFELLWTLAAELPFTHTKKANSNLPKTLVQVSWGDNDNDEPKAGSEPTFLPSFVPSQLKNSVPARRYCYYFFQVPPGITKSIQLAQV